MTKSGVIDKLCRTRKYNVNINLVYLMHLNMFKRQSKVERIPIISYAPNSFIYSVIHNSVICIIMRENI